MIVSYTWAQDAFRVGALVQGKRSSLQRALINKILKDLTDIHGIDDNRFLPGLVLDHHCYNWYDQEHSGGAFALYGPGQFKSLYPSAGEATSVHHARVVGALNSAYRAVQQLLYASGKKRLYGKLAENWGAVNEYLIHDMERQVRLALEAQWKK